MSLLFLFLSFQVNLSQSEIERLWNRSCVRILIKNLIFSGLVQFSRSKNKQRENIYELHFSGGIAKKMTHSVEEVEQLILAILCPSSSAEESSLSSLASDDVGVAGVKRPLDDNGPGFVSSEVILTALCFARVFVGQ